jgi:RNA polymerase sigma-70 factor (ECF subfamily)
MLPSFITMAYQESLPAEQPMSRWFATTHWSTVLTAGADWSPAGEAALERLCRTYWPSLRAYVHHRGFSAEDAEDLTQQFFARFLERKYYQKADPVRGKFRSFLLTSMKHFLISEARRATAQKRGGGQRVLSLDAEPDSDEGVPSELRDERTAESAYERSWGMTVLERVRSRLAAEFAAAEKTERFLQLERFLSGEQTDLSYAEAAARLNVAVGTIKSDIHRLKQRYREILREEIAHTVSTPSEIDEELRHLVTVLRQTSPEGISTQPF